MSSMPRSSRRTGMAAGESDAPPAWFDGATVLVTGASSGIGAALAREAAAHAGVLVLAARRRDRLEDLARELSTVPRGERAALVVDVRPADLATPEGVQILAADVVEAHGGVDILVNNAGFGDYTPLVESEADTIARMVAVNVTAPTLLARAFLPGMIERGQGAVLMVGSSVGQLPAPGSTVYSATKFYVHGLSESLRGELVGTGVQVTELAPGPVATEFDTVSGMGPITNALNGIRIDAAQCAREAWHGLCAGKPIVYPGRAVRAAMIVGSVVPDAAVRPVFGLMGRRARKHSQG